MAQRQGQSKSHTPTGWSSRASATKGRAKGGIARSTGPGPPGSRPLQALRPRYAGARPWLLVYRGALAVTSGEPSVAGPERECEDGRSAIRLFVEAALDAGTAVALASGQAHYLRNVMRQEAGGPDSPVQRP